MHTTIISEEAQTDARLQKSQEFVRSREIERDQIAEERRITSCPDALLPRPVSDETIARRLATERDQPLRLHHHSHLSALVDASCLCVLHVPPTQSHLVRCIGGSESLCGR